MDEEDIFEDIDDEGNEPENEIEDEVVLSIKEEQPTVDVPSNYAPKNKGHSSNTSSSNNFKSDYMKNQKTTNRLKDATTKPKMPNNVAAEAGKEAGKKLAGTSEEEEGTGNQVVDDVAGKAASAGITAATGGAVQGPAADFLGNAAAQVAKKELQRKKKKIAIISAIVIFIVLLVLFILFYDNNDVSDVNAATINYINGTMTDEELVEYLKYMGICSDAGVDYDELSEEEEIEQKGADCKYALQFYKKIKTEYEEKMLSCNAGIEGKKDINKPCEVQLNVPLLFETLSYGKNDKQLWNKRETPNQVEDIENLVSAMTEYVHESCFILVPQYRTKSGKIQETDCDGCTRLDPKKVNKDWYYFQISFDKYVSFLKYGFTSSHPYYLNGSFDTGFNPIRKIFVAKSGEDNILQYGENYDHECVGPTNSEFTSS